METGPSRQAGAVRRASGRLSAGPSTSGRIENDVARIDGRLLMHQFVEGWTLVPLPLAKVAFEKIEINGRPATRWPTGGRDQPAIYLDKSGPHVVNVRFSVPVSRLARPAG